jgi:hypothetical protein
MQIFQKIPETKILVEAFGMMQKFFEESFKILKNFQTKNVPP